MPGEIELEVEDGEALMAAANRAGYYWPTVCAGDAVCTRCFMTSRRKPGRPSPRWTS